MQTPAFQALKQFCSENKHCGLSFLFDENKSEIFFLLNVNNVIEDFECYLSGLYILALRNKWVEYENKDKYIIGCQSNSVSFLFKFRSCSIVLFADLKKWNKQKNNSFCSENRECHSEW